MRNVMIAGAVSLLLSAPLSAQAAGCVRPLQNHDTLAFLRQVRCADQAVVTCSDNDRVAVLQITHLFSLR